MMTNNVIEFDRYVFPVHSKAWHAIYGISLIVEKMGDKRKIRTLKQNSQEMEWEYYIVDVNELARLEMPASLS